MLDLKEFDCTGCTACYNSCPKAAIQMIEDAEGFKFPKIDTDKCVNCGLCELVCVPKNGYSKKNTYPIKVFAAKNRNLSERKESQSGGAFFVLAKFILSQNGVVYGAALDGDFIARHERADNKNDVKRFRGSKYVQSDLGDVFKQVKTDLKDGRYVLFSGTPCQIAGLKAYLGNTEYEKLYLIDLICHGVPSPKVWRDYLVWHSAQGNGKPSGISFRYKSRIIKWGTHYEAFYFRKRKKIYNIYAKLFYSHNILRKSCYSCKFSNLQRVSDISIGDYWGIENVNEAFRDEYGVSAILINSPKGEDLFEKVQSQFDHIETTVEQVIKKNPNLKKSTNRPKSRETFWEDYEKGFDFVAKKYGGWTIIGRLKLFVKRILKKY